MFEEFRGQRVLITGAAGVIGTWIAEAFAVEGARLLLSDIREGKMAVVAERLKGRAQEVICHHTNLTEPGSVDELTALVADKWGAPDIVINNAGIYPSQNLLTMPLEDWTSIMNLNVTAPFLVTRNMANLMINSRIEGNFINMISGAAFRTRVGGGHYSTSKAALAMLTRAFALELAPHNIRVNGVGPGFAPGSEVSVLSEPYVENMITGIPLGRTSGPEDSPSAIMFLCSKKASFITGALLNVDGGRSAGNFKRQQATTEVKR